MLLWIIHVLHIAGCLARYSNVIEGIKHGIYMEDYCPKMGSCEEGTHVVCMYNPDTYNGMGPNCHTAQNVTISKKLSDEILAITNSMRSTIAKGKETGKDGRNLPRGYGMWKLEWDNDLATFAQILANQCLLKHDLCRATRQFPEPGQAVGMMRFLYPNWGHIKSEIGNTTILKAGYSTELLEQAVPTIIRKWYKQKSSITPESIVSYNLNFQMDPQKNQERLYTQIVYGPSTHIGCGVSAYTDYVFSNYADLLYNVIELVCNFSRKPKYNQPVYNTTAPTTPGYSKCGCPREMSDEDTDCLCAYKPEKEEMLNDEDHEADETGLRNSRCAIYPDECRREAPPVVVLPIFTVEDGYPPGSKTAYTRQRNDTEQLENDDEFNPFNDADDAYNVVALEKRKRLARKRGKSFRPRMSPVSIRNSESYLFPLGEALNMMTSGHLTKSLRRNASYEVLKKRTNIPLRSIGKTVNIFVDDGRNDNCEGDCEDSSAPSRKSAFNRNKVPRRKIFDQLLKRNVERINEEYPEDNDQKLINLLDHLEEEVRHVELNAEEKEIIDAKMKKIFKTISGNPIDTDKNDEPSLRKSKIVKDDNFESDNYIPNRKSAQRYKNSDMMYYKYRQMKGAPTRVSPKFSNRPMRKPYSPITREVIKPRPNSARRAKSYQSSKENHQISPKRREYYQKKLKYLEKMVHRAMLSDTRSRKNSDNVRIVRPMRPSSNNALNRRFRLRNEVPLPFQQRTGQLRKLN